MAAFALWASIKAAVALGCGTLTDVEFERIGDGGPEEIALVYVGGGERV